VSAAKPTPSSDEVFKMVPALRELQQNAEENIQKDQKANPVELVAA